MLYTSSTNSALVMVESSLKPVPSPFTIPSEASLLAYSSAQWEDEVFAKDVKEQLNINRNEIINEFLQKYCNARKNYGKNDFSVSFVTNLNDDTTFKIDDDFMKVLLDAILENANRHGFKDGYIKNPQIQISASYTTVNKLPCVLISIANNGASFPDDFAIEQYVREGEFGGSSGNSGRGGFHIYQIAKRHQGYISLSNDDIWNVKVNIMIPLEYYEESEIEKK